MLLFRISPGPRIKSGVSRGYWGFGEECWGGLPSLQSRALSSSPVIAKAEGLWRSIRRLDCFVATLLAMTIKELLTMTFLQSS